jgi:hypothetical protein
MAVNRVPDFPQSLGEIMDGFRLRAGIEPIWLGATSGSGGGAGGAPGGYIGNLNQRNVSYDETEAATLATGSPPSLVDNLNHIRALITSGSGGGGGGGTSGSSFWNQILLVTPAGNVTQYPATSTGLTNALGAASTSSTVLVPTVTIAGGPWTVPGNVTLLGYGDQTILQGAVSNGGFLEHLTVSGASDPQVSSSGFIRRCIIITSGATALSATAGQVYDTQLQGSNSGAATLSISGSASAWFVRVLGSIHSTINADQGLFYCAAAAPFGNQDALTVESGVVVHGHFRALGSLKCVTVNGAGAVYLVDCNLDASDTSTGTLVVNSGTLYVHGNDYASLTINGGSVVSLSGDRSAFDVLTYATLHASDIASGAFLRHLAAPGTPGNVMVDNGSRWVSQPITSGSGGSGGGIVPSLDQIVVITPALVITSYAATDAGLRNALSTAASNPHSLS